MRYNYSKIVWIIFYWVFYFLRILIMRQSTPWSGWYSPPPPSLSALSSSDFMMRISRVSVIQTMMMIGFSSLPQWLRTERTPSWVKSLWSIYYRGRHTLSTLLLKMLTSTTPSVNSFSSPLKKVIRWRVVMGINQQNTEQDQQLFLQYYKEVQKSLLEKWINLSMRSPLQVPLEFFHTTAFASVCFLNFLENK